MCGVIDTKFIILRGKEVVEKLDFTVSNVLFSELSVVYIAMRCIFLCLFFLVCLKCCMIHFKYK